MSTNSTGTRIPKRRTAVFAAFACVGGIVPALYVPAATAAAAAGAAPSSDSTPAMEEVVVTGSLIPQTGIETQTPVSVISTVDLQERGFADVAQALQRGSFATGSIQDGQFSGGFTQGAKVVSLFGLDPSFTKYLIDGRPIADYPALYNGQENFVSISGIPTLLVDHIDILPGAQSSIYGSDAIAGVVNLVMKKNLSGPLAEARYGWTQDGGGTDRLIALADGFTFGSFNVLLGGQYENLTPIWGYQRGLTSQYDTQGRSAQVAERDYAIIGSGYYFEDPASCANVASQFGNSVGLHSRPNLGQYCGTVRSGFYTIGNGEEASQVYLHATDDVNDKLQIFADVLVNHDVFRFSVGAHAFNSSFDSSSPYAYFEDPNVTTSDYLNLQHIFSPEETGGLNNTLDKDTNNSIRGTVGVQGEIGASSWKYTLDMTYTENKLTESVNLLFTTPVEAFFAKIYGPQLGFDSTLGTYMYSPNYAAFYQPVTPADYASFDGDAISHSRTEDSLVRARITNSSLFSLPGGNAGMALQIEGGGQGWDYAPDPRFLDNETFGYTSVGGSGHRSRYAGTAELQLPITSMLSANVSGRYDDYHVAGGSVDKFTYNLGLQFRPVESLLFRGRYGTAFKAPTLADEFQGKSGAYQTLTDYYQCYSSGYTPATITNCPQYNTQSVFEITSGNPKLKPITAEVWDVGSIWSPLSHLSFNVDYIHWAIKDEIAGQDVTKLLETEASCRLGQLDINSPTCVAALAQIVRNASGAIVSVAAPKQNVSQESLGSLILGAQYHLRAGALGDFDFAGAYTDMLSHHFQQFAGDPVIDYLNSPYYSTEFKTKENVSVTWTRDPLSATVYVERDGRTPNYLSGTLPQGYATPGSGNLPPWTLCNVSVGYKPVPKLQILLALNNAFNKMPPVDHSFPGTENQPYNNFNYNVYGRMYYLTASYGAGN